MASLSKIIDVHSHPVLAFGEGAPVGAGGKQPDWSVESALSYMEEHDIAACVLSAPAAANDATGQEARDIARRTNEFLAEILSKHPNRFGAVATLPALDADGAIAEIGYALDTFKMDGVTTTTSINDTYLGEAQFDPWFEELNRRSATQHAATERSGGTPLMQSVQTVGIDLPLKALVWEDADDKTWLSFNEPGWIVQRHSVANLEQVVSKMAAALSAISRAVTNS
jgi:hypothetical protein